LFELIYTDNGYNFYASMWQTNAVTNMKIAWYN
jgi:hypothetical protein